MAAEGIGDSLPSGKDLPGQHRLIEASHTRDAVFHVACAIALLVYAELGGFLELSYPESLRLLQALFVLALNESALTYSSGCACETFQKGRGRHMREVQHVGGFAIPSPPSQHQDGLRRRVVERAQVEGLAILVIRPRGIEHLPRVFPRKATIETETSQRQPCTRSAECLDARLGDLAQATPTTLAVQGHHHAQIQGAGLPVSLLKLGDVTSQASEEPRLHVAGHAEKPVEEALQGVPLLLRVLSGFRVDSDLLLLQLASCLRCKLLPASSRPSAWRRRQRCEAPLDVLQQASQGPGSIRAAHEIEAAETEGISRGAQCSVPVPAGHGT
mmetsp:Transcript_40202/g.87867  ORF Transcript_40202/g.87867 Transcript_40202/m.87867 type:complete len:329 (+) Transcript_40202:978-1964(+)